MTCESCDRLRAERNRLVDTTELGKLSEELEEDNMASAATVVRSAMHELERLRVVERAARSVLKSADAPPVNPLLEGLRAALDT